MSKVDTIFQVVLPPGVQGVLNALKAGTTLGMSSLLSAPAFQCLGFGGFLSALRFWMALPAVLIGGVFVVVGGKLAAQGKLPLANKLRRRVAAIRARWRGGAGEHDDDDPLRSAPDGEGTGRKGVQPLAAEGGGGGKNDAGRKAADAEEKSVGLLTTCLPYVITIFFLLYPQVTTCAFASFACYNFTSRAATSDAPGVYEYYLIADVSVACTNTHANPTNAVAWLAIAIYAFGVLVFTAVLLRQAKHAIVDNKPTPLSEALGFLHKVRARGERAARRPALIPTVRKDERPRVGIYPTPCDATSLMLIHSDCPSLSLGCATGGLPSCACSPWLAPC